MLKDECPEKQSIAGGIGAKPTFNCVVIFVWHAHSWVVIVPHTENHEHLK